MTSDEGQIDGKTQNKATPSTYLWNVSIFCRSLDGTQKELKRALATCTESGGKGSPTFDALQPFRIFHRLRIESII